VYAPEGEEDEQDDEGMSGDLWVYPDMLNMARPKCLVPGLLYSGTSALIFGPSDALKSFLAIDIACSIATNTPWHGVPVVGGSVLYVSTEGAAGVGAVRIPAWMDAHNIPATRRSSIALLSRALALDDLREVDALIKRVRWEHSCGGGEWLPEGEDDSSLALVVVDIFGGSMAGSEVTDETARRWVAGVNKIIRECGATVLTVAHSGWSDHSRARMHSHFWGSFDTRIKAERPKGSMTTILRVNRHKDAESSGTWTFRMEQVPAPGGASTLVPRLVGGVQAEPRPNVSGKESLALQALADTVAAHGRAITAPNFPACPVVEIDRWRAACEDKLTDSTTTDTRARIFRRFRDSLVDKGLVGQIDGFAWEISQ
jgi:hypothetical protein